MFDLDADGRVSSNDLMRALAGVQRIPSNAADYHKAVPILAGGSYTKFCALLQDGGLLNENVLAAIEAGAAGDDSPEQTRHFLLSLRGACFALRRISSVSHYSMSLYHDGTSTLFYFMKIDFIFGETNRLDHLDQAFPTHQK